MTANLRKIGIPWAIYIVFSGLIVAGWISPAGAYVLEGPHVLELMIKKLKGPQTLQVRQQAVIEDPMVSPQPVTLVENLYYSYPDRFRSEIQHDHTQRILVTSAGQVLTIVDNVITSNQEGRFDRYKDPLLYMARDLLFKAFSDHGVDVGVTSLGHWDDQLAWVIGAQYPDESVSQVWVDKDSFFPLRWINIMPARTPSQEPDRMEFVYRKWQKNGGVWYPHQIETFYNQQRIRVTRVKLVHPNVAIKAELFNIAHLMTMYQPPQVPDQDHAGQKQMEEVDRTIDEFKKKFEP